MVAFDHDTIAVNAQATEMRTSTGCDDVPFVAHPERVVVDDHGAVISGARKSVNG